MAYNLTEDQKMIVESIKRLTREKIAPRASEIDREDKFPWDILKLLKENNLMGIDFPMKYGGSEAGLLTECLITEEIAKVSLTCAQIPNVAHLGAMPILLAGSEGQKDKYLPKVAKGEFLAAFSLTEPGAGSDAASVSTKAVRKENKYILNGTKCFITNGGIADIYSVFAKTDQKAKGVKGLSAVIMEKDTAGFSVGKHEEKMGNRGVPNVQLIFEDCEVALENLLGNEGDGFQIAMQTLDFTRPVVAAQALGLAQGALDFAINYARERIQFGKPISTFQGIRWMLADLATHTEAARQLVYKAAAELDRYPKIISRLPAEIVKLSAMCKLFATENAMKVTTDCVQILGGYGYMKDFPMERMMRDAKITQIYEGTNQIQKEVISSCIIN